MILQYLQHRCLCSIFTGLRLYHLIKNITGEKVVLYVCDLDSHWDTVVIGPLLQEGT